MVLGVKVERRKWSVRVDIVPTKANRYPKQKVINTQCCYENIIFYKLCNDGNIVPIRCTAALILTSNLKGNTMEKLLNKYAADRSEKNAMALVKYDNKHPFASMCLTQDQADMLAQAKRVVAFNSRYA